MVPLWNRSLAPCRDREGAAASTWTRRRAPLPQHGSLPLGVAAGPSAPRPPSRLLPDSAPGGLALGGFQGAGILGCSPSLPGATCPGIGRQRDGAGLCFSAGRGGAGTASRGSPAHVPSVESGPTEGLSPRPQGPSLGAPSLSLPEQSQHTRSSQGPQKESEKTLHLSWDSICPWTVPNGPQSPVLPSCPSTGLGGLSGSPRCYEAVGQLQCGHMGPHQELKCPTGEAEMGFSRSRVGRGGLCQGPLSGAGWEWHLRHHGPLLLAAGPAHRRPPAAPSPDLFPLVQEPGEAARKGSQLAALRPGRGRGQGRGWPCPSPSWPWPRRASLQPSCSLHLAGGRGLPWCGGPCRTQPSPRSGAVAHGEPWQSPALPGAGLSLRFSVVP